MKGESEPLVGLLSSWVQVFANKTEGLSVVFECLPHSSGFFMFSSASVEVKSVKMGLFTPQPVSCDRNDDSLIPSIVSKISIIDDNLRDSIRNASNVVEFGVNNSGKVRSEPFIGEGDVVGVEDDGSEIDDALGNDAFDQFEFELSCLGRLNCRRMVVRCRVIGGSR